MVHPTDLLRTDSTGDEGSFVAPLGDYKNDIDCGCSALPCLAQKLNLEKYAKPRCFLGVLTVAGLLSGIVVKYFRGTSQIWSKHYDISQDTVDWLIYTNEIFVGLFALFLAYWGNRMHRPNWLGALTIYLGISCIILAIPEIYQPFRQEETDLDTVNGPVLCQIEKNAQLTDLSVNINNQVIAFGIIILYQVVYALYTVSFIAHGVTYIDDNTSSNQSPIFIALIFASQRMGKQSGIYSAWMPYIYSRENIFVSVVWLLVASLLIIAGTLIAMFPKVMPNTLLRKSVNSLLSIAAGNIVSPEFKSHTDGFFKSLWRLLKNKIVLLNITAMMFMQAAIVNFNIKEKDFNQVKYHVSKYNDASGYSDPALIQISTNLLKQPLIAVSYVAAGLVIAKLKPKPKYLIYWNIKSFVAVLITFAATRFFTCAGQLKNEFGGRLSLPYCSWNCGCFLDGPFHPICLNGETHFSPCWAGCTSYDASINIYENCTCGLNGITTASDGSCDADNCSTFWTLAQAHAVVSSALLGTTYITSLIINLRAVDSKDKALTLGLSLTLLTLIPYLPIRAIYDVIADNFCQIWGKKTCQFYSNNFAIFISILTLCFKVLAILTTIALLPFIGKIELYKNHNSRRESDSGLNFMRTNNIRNIYNNDSMNGLNSRRNEESEADEEQMALTLSPTEVMHQSEGRLNTSGSRSSRSDRINSYLSEGDLVPPLRNNMNLAKSTSRTSTTNSALTNSSLSAIANTVGDDHDSDFSSLQRLQEVKRLENKLNSSQEIPSSSESVRRPTGKVRSLENNIVETDF
ncbi:solute carrier organic anion transporter family member 2A1-like [Euwallacea similis]|uniref:solute carrier organic anion transporter family member 2A1-like n=1 Tax=Euwallacea similis TaxID=1736056 RepID=UPI003450F21E